MATIVSIVYQSVEQEPARQDNRYHREACERANLIAGHGIEGDAKAGRHPQRQINLFSTAWLAARAAEGYRTGPGDFGEQLIIDGLAVEDLATGDRLRLGETAWIEITQPRTGCRKLEAVQGRAVPAPPVGMLARVVEGGEIRVGDSVHLHARPVDTVATE